MRLYRQKLGALEADLRSHERRARLAQSERASVGRPSIHLPRTAPGAGGAASQPAVIAILEEGANIQEEDAGDGAGGPGEAVVILHEEGSSGTGQQDGAIAEEEAWDNQYELDQLTNEEPPAAQTGREENTGQQENGSVAVAGSVCIHVCYYYNSVRLTIGHLIIDFH